MHGSYLFFASRLEPRGEIKPRTLCGWILHMAILPMRPHIDCENIDSLSDMGTAKHQWPLEASLHGGDLRGP